MSESLNFSIHGLVSIYAPQAPAFLQQRLKRSLGGFVTSDTENVEKIDAEKADITFRAWSTAPEMTGYCLQMDALYGFAVVMYNDQPCAVFFRKGRPVVAVELAQPCVIHYRSEPDTSGKIHPALIFALNRALMQKGAYLLHGALLQKDNVSLLIAGPRGIRKTTLVLQMLGDGWNYLADDKSVLHQGTLHRFQDSFLIRDQHLVALGERADQIAELAPLRRGLAGRRQIRTLARRHVNRRFLPSEDRLLNAGISLSLRQLFPDGTQLEKIRPTHGILLLHGAQESIQDIANADALDALTAIQHLAYDEFSALQQMASLAEQTPMPDLRNLLAENLGALSFSKVTVPEKTEPERLYQIIQDNLRSNL